MGWLKAMISGLTCRRKAGAMLSSMAAVAMAAVLLGSASGAEAALVTQTTSWSWGSGAGACDRDRYSGDTAIYLSCDPSTFTTIARQFDRFDPALGTLTAVALTYTSSWQYAATIGAKDHAPSDPDFATGQGVRASGQSWASYSIFLDVPGGGLALRTDVADESCAASPPFGTTCLHETIRSGDFDGGGPLTGVPLSALIAAPGSPVPIDLRLTTHFMAAVSCGSDDTCTQSTSGRLWTGTATLDFTYEPGSVVPEPATALLAALGMIAIALSRSRAAR